MAVKRFKKPKDKLIEKITAPENQERIYQWVYWLGLQSKDPSKFRVVRCGQDFMLMMKMGIYPNAWVTVSMCVEYYPPKYNHLKLVKEKPSP